MHTSKYDPVLKQDIISYAEKGRGTVSYLSKTICEEFINLMAKKVFQHIKDEIKQAKYWGLIVDSKCSKALNILAFYVPCCGHSLNLVGECSVHDCQCAVLFFCH